MHCSIYNCNFRNRKRAGRTEKRADKDAFYIRIIDDGAGFDTRIINADNQHLGIQNITKRLQYMCGGELSITSEIAKGTTAVIRMLTYILYEDESHSRSSQKKLHTVFKTLCDDLEAVGAAYILHSYPEGLSIDASEIDCDLYEYLDGNSSLFNGYYM